MFTKFSRWTVLLLSVGVTGYGLFAYFGLEPGTTVHPTMKATYAAHPWRILPHVGFSALALLLGPLQFFPALRARRRLHRAIGYAYVFAVLGGGVSGLFTAFVAYGGIPSQWGFGLLALLWMGTTLAAVRAARNGDMVAHEAWALRSFALTFAAVTLRIYLGSFFAAGFAFEDFYPVLAWLCWVPNLIFVEWVLLTRRR